MQIKDKRVLRKYFKKIRSTMTAEEKICSDIAVQKAFLESDIYRKSEIILAYVSSDIEVDTSLIINDALKSKIVLCPRCEKIGNIMHFYRIKDTESLEKGRFGISEPKSDCERYDDFLGAVCLVPALSYDKEGFRLGFGKGFYDRFLSDFGGVRVGLCYESCVCDKLIHDPHDQSVDILFTDKIIYDYKARKGS